MIKIGDKIINGSCEKHERALKNLLKNIDSDHVYCNIYYWRNNGDLMGELDIIDYDEACIYEDKSSICGRRKAKEQLHRAKDYHKDKLGVDFDTYIKVLGKSPERID